MFGQPWQQSVAIVGSLSWLPPVGRAAIAASVSSSWVPVPGLVESRWRLKGPRLLSVTSMPWCRPGEPRSLCSPVGISRWFGGGVKWEELFSQSFDHVGLKSLCCHLGLKSSWVPVLASHRNRIAVLLRLMQHNVELNKLEPTGFPALGWELQVCCSSITAIH